MNESTVSCDTAVLSNGSRLYWQYNCDNIWLTLENVKKQKTVIDEVPAELFAYTFRLGFHLEREFQKSILFRSSCAANGPCTYVLIDKSSGKKLKEFGQLICVDTDDVDFVVYFDNKSDQITVY